HLVMHDTGPARQATGGPPRAAVRRVTASHTRCTSPQPPAPWYENAHRAGSARIGKKDRKMTRSRLIAGCLRGCTSAALCATLCAAALPGTARADSVSDFYAGKTITLIAGFPPGGGYDTYVRVLAHHFG